MAESMPPKLLILNQMAGPMTWELAEDLGQSLGSVALLTGHPDTLQKKDARVDLHAAVSYRRGSFVHRAISWLQYTIQAFFWLWRWPRTTPLLLFSNPPVLCWLGYLMRKLRGQRYSVMVHDIFPNMLVAAGGFRERHPLVRAWFWLNRKAYESADVVMTLGEFMATHLEEQFDSKRTCAEQVEIVYPWVDINRITPIPKEKNWFAGEHHQLAKVTIMYSGNMGLGHDIETMLEAAKRLQDMPNVHFMFVGAGPKWQLVNDTINHENLSNVTLLPWQPEEVLPFSLATADIALISLEKELTGLAVPSKTIYSLAAGSAVVTLAFQPGELCSWLQTHGFGFAIEPGDSLGLEKVIRTLAHGHGELRCYSERARQAAEDVFSRRTNSKRIADLIKRFSLGTSGLS